MGQQRPGGGQPQRVFVEAVLQRLHRRLDECPADDAALLIDLLSLMRAACGDVVGHARSFVGEIRTEILVLDQLLCFAEPIAGAAETPGNAAGRVPIPRLDLQDSRLFEPLAPLVNELAERRHAEERLVRDLIGWTAFGPAAGEEALGVERIRPLARPCAGT